MRDLDAVLADELARLESLQARRACPELSGHSRVRVAVAGRPALSFASNDYLDLACDPRVAAAAAEAAQRDGYGSSAARLVSGDLPAHRELEARSRTSWPDPPRSSSRPVTRPTSAS